MKTLELRRGIKVVLCLFMVMMILSFTQGAVYAGSRLGDKMFKETNGYDNPRPEKIIDSTYKENKTLNDELERYNQLFDKYKEKIGNDLASGISANMPQDVNAPVKGPKGGGGGNSVKTTETVESWETELIPVRPPGTTLNYKVTINGVATYLFIAEGEAPPDMVAQFGGETLEPIDSENENLGAIDFGGSTLYVSRDITDTQLNSLITAITPYAPNLGERPIVTAPILRDPNNFDEGSFKSGYKSWAAERIKEAIKEKILSGNISYGDVFDVAGLSINVCLVQGDTYHFKIITNGHGQEFTATRSSLTDENGDTSVSVDVGDVASCISDNAIPQSAIDQARADYQDGVARYNEEQMAHAYDPQNQWDAAMKAYNNAYSNSISQWMNSNRSTLTPPTIFETVDVPIITIIDSWTVDNSFLGQGGPILLSSGETIFTPQSSSGDGNGFSPEGFAADPFGYTMPADGGVPGLTGISDDALMMVYGGFPGEGDLFGIPQGDAGSIRAIKAMKPDMTYEESMMLDAAESVMTEADKLAEETKSEDLKQAEKEFTEVVSALFLDQALPGLLREGDTVMIRDMFYEIGSEKDTLIANYRGAVTPYYVEMASEFARNIDALKLGNILSNEFTEQAILKLSPKEIDVIVKKLKEKENQGIATAEEKIMLAKESNLRATYITPNQKLLEENMTAMLKQFTQKVYSILYASGAITAEKK